MPWSLVPVAMPAFSLMHSENLFCLSCLSGHIKEKLVAQFKIETPFYSFW
jgi:hypothetical protein